MNIRTGDGKHMHIFEFREVIQDRKLSVLIDIDGKDICLPRSKIYVWKWSKIVEIPEWLAITKGLL